MVRASLLLVLVAGCGPSLDVFTDDLTDLPLPALSDESMARFVAGDGVFESAFTEGDGLGPLSIRQNCAACHRNGGRGPGFVEKLVQLGSDGRPVEGQPLVRFGHTVRRQRSAGALTPIDVSDGLSVTQRVGPSIWASGAIEAIADETIVLLEQAQAQRTDGVSGRVNWVTYRSKASVDPSVHQSVEGMRVIGRFGVKARIGYVDDFAADAFQGDMGLTSPLRPDEPQNPDGLRDDRKPGVDVSFESLRAVADYLRLLRLPARRPTSGASLFTRVGCDTCHISSLPTRADYPVSQLAGTNVAIFTDLLLHDMGAALSDGLSEGTAGEREYRTPPLVGLRFARSFLHDGRAANLTEAVRWHGAPDSEAAASARAFESLSVEEQRALLDYVLSL
jgi:CxxC motif-containing protein (DUF1111 family)